jgi:hypothetical protein
MIVILLVLSLSALVLSEDRPSRRHQAPMPLFEADLFELNQNEFIQLKKQKNLLERVKYFLLNGQSDLARAQLTQLAYTRSALRPVIYRYIGLLNFLEGNFKESLEFLSKKELQLLPYRRICLLKVFNMIALDLKDELEAEWNRCQMENANHLDLDKIIWPQLLVEMKLRPRLGLARVPFKNIRLGGLDNNQLKIFLKLALYLNQEALLVPQIPELDLSQLEDPEVRELVGVLLLRKGALVRSYQFIEDLHSPNAQNVKGNLQTMRQKYQLAHDHFKLSLDKKTNSLSAMERLLPLSWLLEEWEMGEKRAREMIALGEETPATVTALAAFLTQRSEFQKSSEVLRDLWRRSDLAGGIEVNQLQSFNTLMQNKSDQAMKYAWASCQDYDLTNCWLSLQLMQWDDLPMVIKRQDKLPQRRDWEKLSSAPLLAPLKEEVYVNQLDIEEMDDKFLEMIEKPKK